MIWAPNQIFEKSESKGRDLEREIAPSLLRKYPVIAHFLISGRPFSSGLQDELVVSETPFFENFTFFVKWGCYHQLRLNFRFARDPETTVSGQASGPPVHPGPGGWVRSRPPVHQPGPFGSTRKRPALLPVIYTCLVPATEWNWTGTRERHAACCSTSRSNLNLRLPGHHREQAFSMAGPCY